MLVGNRKKCKLTLLRAAVKARSDRGKPMPNYSNFLGDVFSGALSNATIPMPTGESTLFSPTLPSAIRVRD